MLQGCQLGLNQDSHTRSHQQLQTQGAAPPVEGPPWPREEGSSLGGKDTARTSPAFPNVKAACHPNNKFLIPGKFILKGKHLLDTQARQDT